ncbi:MAG: 3-deoxy-manno-octulosonate cytidylyltransferase [Pseudomonadota bacterium]
MAGTGTVAVMIPARRGSTRFPGKPLAPLRGANGAVKPLIRWTWERAVEGAGDADVHVLTDDEGIAGVARGFGANVVMTPTGCANGTERCAAALDAALDAEIVVNVQGDSPLMPPGVVGMLVRHLERVPDAMVATPVFVATGEVRTRLLTEAMAGRVGGTTVLTDAVGRALYFSRHVLPHGAAADPAVEVSMHLGIYAYRRAALATYPDLSSAPAEMAEGLEQLRFLDAGLRVDAVSIAAPTAFWEVNRPEDVAVVEAALMAAGRS